MPGLLRQLWVRWLYYTACVHTHNLSLNVISSVPRPSRRREMWWMILVSSVPVRLIPVPRPNQHDLTRWTWTKMVCEHGIPLMPHMSTCICVISWFPAVAVQRLYLCSLGCVHVYLLAYLRYVHVHVYFWGELGRLLPWNFLAPPLEIRLQKLY